MFDILEAGRPVRRTGRPEKRSSRSTRAGATPPPNEAGRKKAYRKAAKMVREHLWGILNAVVLKATNAVSESVNAKIQWIKYTACGFRNRERFRNAIYFHCGDLHLYPEALRATHTTS